MAYFKIFYVTYKHISQFINGYCTGQNDMLTIYLLISMVDM